MSDGHTQTQSAGGGFAELGIAPALLEALRKLDYHTPTPIQTQAIPSAIQGKDVVGIAQTGTGKTLAFGIPMIQRLAVGTGRGLVVLPTRELALQVDEALREVGAAMRITTAVLIGGTSLLPQIQALRKNPRIVIATPGRLIDHLHQGTIRLDAMQILVLDEADRMLDMGFAPQIKKIFAYLPRERQTMLFSATMPKEIMALATAQMKLPIRVEVAPAGTTAEHVTQELFVIRKNDKNRLIESLLQTHAATTLIFTRTKYGAKRLVRMIRELGVTVAELHSNRSLNQRREALDGFKSGKYRVLVATDIASRGIDVQGIGLVINYDVPTDAEDYVHRIGRTARAGESGHAITLATPEQRGEIRDIERLVRQTLRVSPLPNLPSARTPVAMPPMGNRGNGRRYR
ncbi:MAG: DEAD/DEAH box helicase [Candidatus Harrisonbacteria bacterium]|nr:DEAD/DEAH box helicase [Candidatus Harrisonbacteria bacterium]